MISGYWIWTSENTPERNAFVRFRRKFSHTGGSASVDITADSRYVLYVNGTYLGQGPVRCWPNHWRSDTYDIEPYLTKGDNLIAVLVQHYGEGTFQYLPGPAGLLCRIQLGGSVMSSDTDWKASPDPSFGRAVPRISVQEGFEEQYDGRDFDGWTSPLYDDTPWKPAAELRPADDGFHRNVEDRGIPFLTFEPVLPQRLVSTEIVESIPYRFTVHAKPYLSPSDLTSNMVIGHVYLATQVWSPRDADIAFGAHHRQFGPLKVNGRQVENGCARLHEGWNSLVMRARGSYHLPEFGLCFDGPEGLKISATADVAGSSWAIVGPFAFSSDEEQHFRQYQRDEPEIFVQPLVAEATCEAGDAFWDSGDTASAIEKPYFQQVRPEHLPPDDIFVQAYTDKVSAGEVRIAQVDGLLSGSEWTTVHPAADGRDVRILLDFGREIIGYHRFDVDAPAGTTIDFHNFEFIQPDGRYNFAEGMNNSLRYTCRDGVQTYQSYVRRGFQYSYLILRNMNGPVKLRNVQVIVSTYPQSRRGRFACSDAKLDRIWEVGANSLRCCAEDTYTDCPTYEQTHWVGDARNEALVDWAINGDPRLWYRCLEQTGDSLERSPITESLVPSAWQNILPAWSFLWMRSCREYMLFSGDREKSRKLMQFVKRNVDGIARHLNTQGLFEIRAWNMFDWAAMDTPPYGVVTHQNCLAVHALNDTAEMAEWLGEIEDAGRWRDMASSLSDAINAHMWNEDKGAYTDCLRGHEMSAVYSQQTQTAAFMSGVARGARAERCRNTMYNPPEGFVKAGSPFFEFFLLEALQREGREQEFIDTIRRDWGFMVDMGATTFWEMWSAGELGFGSGERLTRSHCHGWSAAPTFFLSTYVLGVTPALPGFQEAVIAPHPGDLCWCRGTVPAPAGDIEVQWENHPGKPFAMRVKSPEGIGIRVRLPREGTVHLNGREISDLAVG